MFTEGWIVDVSTAAVAGIVSFAVFGVFAVFLMRRSTMGQGIGAQTAQQAQIRTAFLFDDEVLVDATPAARQLLSLAQRGGTSWARLMQVLRGRFPSVEDRLAELLDRGAVSITSEDGRSLLQAEWFEGLARLQLQEVDGGSGEGEVQIDRLALIAMKEEVELFRGLAARFPFPTWIETAEGRISWANEAYLTISDAHGSQTGFPSWPPSRIFGDMGEASSRRALPSARGTNKWYELEQIKLGEDRLIVAVPADHVVAAETSRQEILQTLTKTFASLSLGLAVFDRNRRLILFNPALSDLTGMGAEFLIQQPSFDAFAEKLREARILPEPRDFNQWKQSILHKVSEAEQGTLSESWALPDGRTYEVQGRPLPDGAIAFLVQDISSGMRLMRQFRADLSLHEDILDRLDAPIAIFGRDGQLFTANNAYRELWGEAAETSISDAKSIWQHHCQDVADWDIDEAIGEDRTYQAQTSDGSQVRADLRALPGGAVMVQFKVKSTSERSRAIPQTA